MLETKKGYFTFSYTEEVELCCKHILEESIIAKNK